MSKSLQNKKYWEFKNQTTTEADLYLYTEIAWWGAGYVAHSAQSFKAELDALGEIQTLNIYINSPGGDVFEGTAIYNMIKRKSYQKNVYIDGIAASIASVIALSGDKIYMPSNTMMMLHNPWTEVCGNASDLRKVADTLDKTSEAMRQIYLEKSNGKLDEKTLIKLLNAETWLTAQECFDYDLCDEVISSQQLVAKFTDDLLAKYKNTPEKIANELFAKSSSNTPKAETESNTEKLNKLNKLKLTVIAGLSKGDF